MLWYIAFISVVNLGVGYALAVYLGAANRHDSVDEDDLPPWPDTTTAPSTQSYADAEPPAIAEVEPMPAADDVADDASPDESASTAPDADLTAASAPVIAPADLDPVTELASRDYGQRRLAEMVENVSDPGWATAVLVELNWDGDADEQTMDRLLRGVAGTVRGLTGRGETAARYGDRQFLLVLPGSDTDQATERAETARQRVESTKYFVDGSPWPMALTCALADLRGHSAVDEVFDLLDEALAEARRYGGNRTFLHDGLSPAPVVPLDLGLTLEQCAV